MFKLIKILNSGVNVPEPCRIPKATGTAFKAGSAVMLADGAAISCTATQAPEFITMAAAASTEDSVLCYKVFPDMIFEAPITAAPSALSVGESVTLGIDGDGEASAVTATVTSGVAYIYSLDGASTAGDKVTVKF